MLEHVDTVLSFAVVMLLLSLLITGLVQIVVAMFAQRRAVLKLGIERLLKQIAPKLAGQASEIAEAVLTYPALSLGKSPRAAAAGNAAPASGNPAPAPEDPAPDPKRSVIAILKNYFTTILKGPTAIKKEELIEVLADLATSAPSWFSSEVKAVLQDLTKIDTQPELKQAAQNLMTEINNKFPKEAATIKDFVERTIAPDRKIAINVDTWFDTVMDRTTDEFQRRTRWFTVGFAIVLAFAFHIDSLKIFQRLASDAELRARLVQSADATLNKAEAFLPVASGSSKAASTAIQEAFKKLGDKPAFRTISNVPPEVVTHAQVMAWIPKTFKDPNDQQKIRTAYETQLKEIAGPEVGELLKSTSEIMKTLEDSTLVVFSKSLPGLKDINQYWSNGTHFWGTLITAFFLSLGAPFWYNALKQLSNLRPAIAQKVDLASELKE
jgi:ABC-type Na+ efflux pump permease subunit